APITPRKKRSLRFCAFLGKRSLTVAAPIGALRKQKCWQAKPPAVLLLRGVDPEGVEAVAGGDQDILAAVEHVADRASAGGRHQRGVPEDLPSAASNAIRLEPLLVKRRPPAVERLFVIPLP